MSPITELSLQIQNYPLTVEHNANLNKLHAVLIILLKKILFFHIFHIISQFNLGFLSIFHIFSLFNLAFIHIFHIISLFNLLFFRMLHILSQFSSVFSKSFHFSTCFHSIFFVFFLPHDGLCDFQSTTVDINPNPSDIILQRAEDERLNTGHIYF